MLKTVFALMLILPFVAQTQTGSFVIKGKAGNYGAPAKVYLKYRGSDQMITDSCLLNAGNFVLKGTVREPTLASLFLSREGNGLVWPYDERLLFIETGQIDINSRDSVNNAVITGSPVNKDFDAYQHSMAPIYVSMMDIENQVHSADPSVQSSPAFKRKTDSLKAETERQEDLISLTFILNHPGSYVSLYALQNLSRRVSSPDWFTRLRSLYDQLEPSLRNSPQGLQLAQALTRKRAVMVGMHAPDFVQPDSAGKAVSLYSFRGSYVLLHFWASWCKPCRKENKYLVQAYKRFQSKPFTVVSISIDQQRDKWLKAIHEDQLPWTELCDLKRVNAAASLYEIDAYPSSFLIDPAGKIIAVDIRGEDLEDRLSEIFGTSSAGS